jgi:hypothetical protein
LREGRHIMARWKIGISRIHIRRSVVRLRGMMRIIRWIPILKRMRRIMSIVGRSERAVLIYRRDLILS